MNRYLSVLVGGALGSALRYAVGTAIANRYAGRFPLSTFIVNVTGSFLIGVLLTALARESHLARLFLVTGFLGGYTTFSAFEWEAFSARGSWIAFAYIVSSVAVGYAACWAGAMLFRR